jgi:hypothetical protein
VGVFANALSSAVGWSGSPAAVAPQKRFGLAAWLLAQVRRYARKDSHLELVERISLAPRQTAALIEVDGQRLLVVTSSDGAPAIFPLKAARSRASAKRPCLARMEGKNQ